VSRLNCLVFPQDQQQPQYLQSPTSTMPTKQTSSRHARVPKCPRIPTLPKTGIPKGDNQSSVPLHPIPCQRIRAVNGSGSITLQIPSLSCLSYSSRLGCEWYPCWGSEGCTLFWLAAQPKIVYLFFFLARCSRKVRPHGPFPWNLSLV
jgi:hypothetical protein